MRSIPEQFYKTKTWQRCRDAYMRYCGGLCERCKEEGKIVPADIVHHKEHLSLQNFKDPSVAYNFDNLEALCQDCHNAEHFQTSVERRWKISNSGCISISPDDSSPCPPGQRSRR